MKLVFLFIGCCLLTILPATAQELFSMEKYLHSALNDQGLEKYHAQLDFMDQNNFNAPWLNRLEFRIGSESANISLDEYRLRLTPANPFEIKANKLYFKKQLESINADYQVGLNKALENRYILLIDHYYYSNVQNALKQRQLITNELLNIYRQSNFQGFGMNDLIDLESDRSDILLELSESELELKELEYYIFMDVDSITDINWEGKLFISIDQVKQFILQLEFNTDQENIFIQKAEKEFALKEQEFKVEMSEARRNIGYIQGNFENDSDKELSEKIGLQVGVRIPIVNPDKPDLNRDRFDLIDDLNDVNSMKELVKKRSELLSIRLNSLFEQHDIINERIKAADHIMPIIGLDKGLDARQLVEKKLYQIKLTEKRIDIERDIYDAYIDLLNIQGVLVRQPLVNYLSASFSSLEVE